MLFASEALKLQELPQINKSIHRNANYHHTISKTIRNHPILMLFCFSITFIGPISFRKLDQVWQEHIGKDVLSNNTLYRIVIFLFTGIIFSVVLRGLIGQLIEWNISESMKISTMNHLLQCKQETIEKYGNNLIKLYESPKIISEYIGQCFSIISAIISFILSFYDLQGHKNFKRIVMAFIIIKVIAATMIRKILKIPKYVEKLSQLSMKINNFQQDNINNAIIIKINGAENIRQNKYKKYIEEYTYLSKKIWFLRLISLITPMIIIPIGIITSYHCSTNITLEQLRHSFMLNRHVGEIAGSAPGILNAKESLKNNNNMISDLYFEEYNSKNTKSIGKINSIEVKNLDFTIGTKNIRGSFTINSTDSVALVGKSGAGKTTLLKLLMGTILHKSVIINEKSITNINVKDYRKNMTYIHQSPLLFNDTIEQNLSITGINDHKKYDEVAKNVGLYNRIYSNPINYRQMISNFSLSGGEKQRLSMMICLLKPKYSLVILDEPTSNLDYFNKKLFDNLVKKLFYKKTMLLWIDHNRDIVDIVDYVIFIDNSGQIHYDNHNNLLKNNREYRDYFSGTDVDYSHDEKITPNN